MACRLERRVVAHPLLGTRDSRVSVGIEWTRNCRLPVPHVAAATDDLMIAACVTRRSDHGLGGLTCTASQEIDQGDEQAAQGNQFTEQPFQKIGLDRLEVSHCLLAQGLDAGL